jgi:hypothetical protein
MKKICCWLGLLLAVGCAAPKVDLDVGKMKSKQKQRVQSANQGVKDQTGTDLGTVKPAKRKFGMPTAPVDP